MGKLDIQQFGATIKQKYPQYSHVSDYELGNKTLQKYPQYSEKVNFSFDVQAPVKTKEQRMTDAVAGAEKAKQEAKKANSVGGFLGNFGKAFVENIAPSEVGLGKTIAKLDNKSRQSYADSLNSTQGQQAILLKSIKSNEEEGKDASKLKYLYNENLKQINELQDQLDEANNLPSTGKVLGQLGGTALDVLTAGTYGKAATGMKSASLSTKASRAKTLATATGLPELGQIATQTASGLFTKKGALNVAKGAGIGYANDVTLGAQGLRGEDRTGNKAFIPGLSTAIGVGLPLISEGTQSFKNRYRPTKEQIGKAVNELESKYTEWSTGTKPGKKMINKLNQKTDALNKAGTTGRTPMRTLAETGIVPEIKGTRFNTFDQAADYRNTISSLQDVNRSALQEAGLSTTPTKLDVLQQKAIEFARSKENINSGRAEKMTKEIIAEFNILRNEYPDGNIPIGLQDEIKAARWKNVFGTKGLVDADILKKDSEYAIAKAFQKNIEEVAAQAGHTDVAQLNREIGDRLEAARFLETLDGKVLKGGRVGKYVGTLIGSSVANSVPGKIIGALGGNMVADYLIKSSVHSPMRRSILMKLAKEDPDAYQMTVKWLTEQDALRGSRLALPAPSSKKIINEGRPIKAFPRNVEGEYTGKDIVSQSKSPTAQQTNPAITAVNKNPISDIIPPKVKSVNSVQISQKAVELTKKNGGATINLDGDVPTAGFAYSPFKDVETVIPKATFGEKNVDEFINKHFDKLDQDGHHLGIWEDNGNVYIDISKVNPNEQLAVADSIKNNQIGLFDLSTFETKYIKDYEKTSNAYIHKGQIKGANKEGSIGAISKKETSSKVTLPKKNNKQSGLTTVGTLNTGAKVTTALTVAATIFKKLQDKFGTITYTAEQPAVKTENKQIDPKVIEKALLHLESSNGTDKGSADPGELKWLVGLTPIAIKELKRTGIKKHVKINDKEDVLDAGVKYFQLLQKRNPNLTPAEVYVYKYWAGGKDEAIKKKKIDQFNQLAMQ